MTRFKKSHRLNKDGRCPSSGGMFDTEKFHLNPDHLDWLKQNDPGEVEE